MKIQDAIKITSDEVNMSTEYLTTLIKKNGYSLEDKFYSIFLSWGGHHDVEENRYEVDKINGLEIKSINQTIMDTITLDVLNLYENEDGSWYGEVTQYDCAGGTTFEIENFNLENL